MKKLNLLILGIAIVPMFSMADELTGSTEASTTDSTETVTTGATATVQTGDAASHTGHMQRPPLLSGNRVPMLSGNRIPLFTGNRNFSGERMGSGTMNSGGFLRQMQEARKGQLSGAWLQVKEKHDEFANQWSGQENDIKKNWEDFRTKYPQDDTSWKWVYASGTNKDDVEALRKQRDESEANAFESLKALYKAGTGDATTDFYTPRIEGLNNFYTNMRQYIAADSLGKYDQFVSDIMNVYKTNSQLRADRFTQWTQFNSYRESIITEVGKVPSGLSEKIDKILSKVSDEKKIKALTKLIQAIDKNIEKVNSGNLTDKIKEAKINYLNGVKALAQSKLEGLQSSASENLSDSGIE